MSMSVSSMANNSVRMSRLYQQLSSGKKINSAADNSAGLQIAQKLTAQVNGYRTGLRNVGTAQDMTKVAEGALSSITDNLQRIRELSVQASNGIYSEDERGAIQQEIDQLKQSIGNTAAQTQFNGKNILDGSQANVHVASGPDGSGTEIDMASAALKSLGIADYDVTSGDFDISVIDDALNQVSSSRSSLGAASNGMDYMMAYNEGALYNTAAALSRTEDLDYGMAVSELKKEQLLQTYGIMMQKKMMENESGRMLQLF